jgi:hypothetical protein
LAEVVFLLRAGDLQTGDPQADGGVFILAGIGAHDGGAGQLDDAEAAGAGGVVEGFGVAAEGIGGGGRGLAFDL